MRLGIDFGTCYSSAALMLNGTLKPIKEPLKHGFSFPSSIFLTEQGEVLVGQAAENSRQKNPQRYKNEFKRNLGSPDPYIMDGHPILPEELAAEVIRKLKTEADKVARGWEQEPFTDVIITIPATYQAYKRDLMQEAGIQAGFTNVELLEEPLAAAIYYANYERVSEEEIILVYDLGGGTFDATLIQKQASSYQLLAMPKGLPHCGGTDFDRQIYQDLRKRCSAALRQQLDDKGAWLARAIVSEFCRDQKHQLSEEQEAVIYIPIGLGAVEPYSLTQQSFNSMIAPLIHETIECCDQLLRSAQIEWQQVNQVLLVGGSCRIPYVREAVARKLGRQPLLVDEPELAVCMGAAIYGAQLDTVKDSPEHKPEEPKHGPQEKAEPQPQGQEKATFYYTQGLERSQERNYWRALEDFNQALQINSNYAEAYYARGVVRFQLGDSLGAIEDLQKASKLFVDRGNTADYQKAIDKIKQFNDPQSTHKPELNLEAIYKQGLDNSQIGNYATAIASFDQVLQQNPQHAGAYFQRGFARFCRGESQTAIEDCDRAISIDPNHADAYTCRAFAYFSLEKYKNTVQDCNRALQINPNHGGAFLGLAVVRSFLGVHQKALEDFQRFRRVAPNLNSSYYNKILARSARGDNRTVMNDLQEAAKELFSIHKSENQI